MILIATVRHSQSVTATPLHPWSAAKRSGMIFFSHCTCMAGLGEACFRTIYHQASHLLRSLTSTFHHLALRLPMASPKQSSVPSPSQGECSAFEWSWLKASLPSSMGGLGLRQALHHSPAAYIGSWVQCKSLSGGILGHSPPPPSVFPVYVSDLAETAGRCRCSSHTMCIV